MSTYSQFYSDAYLRNHFPDFNDLDERFSRYSLDHNAFDKARSFSIYLNCRQILKENILGDFVELGVWKGNTAATLAKLAKEANREVFLFDTFDGFDSKDRVGIDADKSPELFKDTSLELVKEVIGDSEHCHFVKGYFPESVQEEHTSRTYALVHLDCDLYKPTLAGLNFFYSRMPKGGLCIVHDYLSPWYRGCTQAVDEFCAQTGESLVVMPDKCGSAIFRKNK